MRLRIVYILLDVTQFFQLVWLGLAWLSSAGYINIFLDNITVVLYDNHNNNTGSVLFPASIRLSLVSFICS